jgi:hypothetical protein
MSMGDEYSGRQSGKKKQKSHIRAFLPALGLIMAVALAGVAYVASEPIHQLLMDNMPSIPAAPEMQYVIAAVMWIIMLAIVGMVYAAAAPKPTKMISEKVLEKEKADRLREKRMVKKRKQQIARERARLNREERNP